MSRSAILFDLDGTLLDTLQDIGGAVNRVLAARGYVIHPIYAYKDFVGEGARLLIERALPPAARTEAVVSEVLAAYREEYKDTWNIATRAYEGVPQLLAVLMEHGIRMGVLSNKPHRETVKCVNGYFPDGLFHAVLGQREEVPRKPDPAGALEAAALMEADPSEIVYVGDTGVDMQTAAAAGMFSVGVTWGFRPESELRANGAKAIVRHPTEILQFFEE